MRGTGLQKALTRHLILFALGLGGSQSWATHYQLPVGSFVDSTCKVGARLVVGIHIPLRNQKAALLQHHLLEPRVNWQMVKADRRQTPLPSQACLLWWWGWNPGLCTPASGLPLTTYLVPWCFEADFKVTILLPLPPSTQITGLGHHALQVIESL